MRATARLCALGCALLAVLPASAQASIKPLPRPAGIAAAPRAVSGTSLIAPVTRPAMRQPVTPARRPVVTRSAITRRRPPPVRRHRFVPARSQGGRERAWRVLSRGGREAPPVTGPLPTPLAFVGTGELLPAYSSPLAAWKVAALVLLAFGEGFVLVRLLRGNRFARPRELV